MGYSKLIQYSNNIELYEYEKNLVPKREFSGRPVFRRLFETFQVERCVVNGGEDTLLEGKKKIEGRRPDNARRASVAFRRIVLSNLDGVELPLLFTFTYEENNTDLRKGYDDFKTFIKYLRYKFGSSFKYITVPEFQKRGAVHFHSLFWGLSLDLVDSERKTRFFAKAWGQGFVFIKKTDGNEKIASYLAKYMSKAFLDSRLLSQKSYVASRNISRPIFISGINFNNICDEVVGVDNYPCIDKSFMTKWLGMGRFRLFKI